MISLKLFSPTIRELADRYAAAFPLSLIHI